MIKTFERCVCDRCGEVFDEVTIGAMLPVRCVVLVTWKNGALHTQVKADLCEECMNWFFTVTDKIGEAMMAWKSAGEKRQE